MSDHPLDDLAAYALDALEPRERAAVEAHVRGCDSCRDEVERYRGALIAYASASEDDAPDLRSRIVARAKRDGAPRSPRRWATWLVRPLPAFVPAALAVVLVVSLALLVVARRDADAYATALSQVAGARTVSLAPADPSSGLRGVLVVPETGSAYLLLRIPTPPAGKAWEAWVLRPEAPAAAGLTTTGGVVTLTLTAPWGPGDGVAVTLEPAGGVSAPTTAPVLVAPRSAASTRGIGFQAKR